MVKEWGQQDKQWSTKHYTDNKRLSNTNLTKKPEVNSCPPDRYSVDICFWWYKLFPFFNKQHIKGWLSWSLLWFPFFPNLYFIHVAVWIIRLVFYCLYILMTLHFNTETLTEHKHWNSDFRGKCRIETVTGNTNFDSGTYLQFLNVSINQNIICEQILMGNLKNETFII